MSITRRGFISGLACGTVGLVGAGLAGCSPAQSTTPVADTGAGADAATEPVEAEIEVSETKECDVVVVGAGISGLSASVQASELGLSVIQLDKGQEAGGWGAGTEGIMFVDSALQKEQSIKVEPADVVTAEVAYTHNRIDAMRWVDICHNASENFDWLVDKGVRFSGQVDDYRGAGNGLNIFHWFETGTARESYCDPMIAAAQDQGVEILLETQGDKLLMEDGKVAGIYAKQDKDTILIKCKAVILATGGVAANDDYMKYGKYNMERLINTREGMDGDGLRMALEVGGVDNLSDVSALEVLAVGDIASGTKATYTRNGIDRAATFPNTLWINERSERFCSENAGSDNWMAILTPTKYQTRCFTIFDQATVDGNFKTMYGDDQEKIDEYVGDFEEMISDDARDGVRADTLDELVSLAVKKYDILDEDTLKETLATYNEMCAAGIDTLFGKPAEHMVTLENGPFYLVELQQTVCVAFGGIKTDRNYKVIDESRQPIPGLYAIGVEGSMLWPNIYTINVPGGSNGNNVNGGRVSAKMAFEYINA